MKQFLATFAAFTLSLVSIASIANANSSALCLEVFSSATSTKSTALQEFNDLLTEKPTANYVRELSNQIFEKYEKTLTFDEFIYLRNFGRGGNFTSETSFSFIRQVSQRSPVTVKDIELYIERAEFQDVVAVFSFIKKQGSEGTTTRYDIIYSGSNKEFIDFLTRTISKIENSKKTKFLESVFSEFTLGNLIGFKFSQAELESLITQLPTAAISYKALETMQNTFGLARLAEIDPRLLISRLSLENVDSYQAVSLALLLYSYKMDTLIDIRAAENFPSLNAGVLIQVLTDKNEARKSGSIAQEEVTSRLFAELGLHMSLPHSSLEGARDVYKALWETAGLVEKGVISEDQVYAQGQIMDWVRTEFQEYPFFVPGENFKYTFNKDIVEISGAGPDHIIGFYSVYFQSYKTVARELFKSKTADNRNYKDIIYNLPEYGRDLLVLDITYGSVTKNVVDYYFNLRAGIIVGQANLWEKVFGQKPTSYTHEEAIAIIEKQLKEE